MATIHARSRVLEPASDRPPHYRSSVVTKYLTKPDTDELLAQVRLAYRSLVGDGVADLERLPATQILEAPKGNVYRYEPSADPVAGRLPVLLVPPMAAISVAFDLRRGHSLAEYLLAQGRPVYLVDYGDVSSLHDSDLGLEHWIDEVVPNAIRAVSEDAGGQPVHLLGWCLGGILSMMTEAAHDDLPIASIATVASPFDFREVRVLEPVRVMEQVTGGTVTTGLVRVLGGVPGKANGLIFKWLSPDKQLKKPLTRLRNRDNPEVLAQIEAVDALMDGMEAYPGRSIAQIYHSFVRTNKLAEGKVKLSDDRVIELAGVDVPVMNIAGDGDLFFAPPASVYRLGELLPNAPEVRLETAPGGHLGVLAGRKARDTTWVYLTDFLRDVEAGRLGGPEEFEEAVEEFVEATGEFVEATGE